MSIKRQLIDALNLQISNTEEINELRATLKNLEAQYKSTYSDYQQAFDEVEELRQPEYKLAMAEREQKLKDDINISDYNRVIAEQEESLKCANSINLKWHIEDVIEHARDSQIMLSEDQARDILGLIKKNHDCTIGVNWEVIGYAIDNYLGEMGAMS